MYSTGIIRSLLSALLSYAEYYLLVQTNALILQGLKQTLFQYGPHEQVNICQLLVATAPKHALPLKPKST